MLLHVFKYCSPLPEVVYFDDLRAASVVNVIVQQVCQGFGGTGQESPICNANSLILAIATANLLRQPTTSS